MQLRRAKPTFAAALATAALIAVVLFVSPLLAQSSADSSRPASSQSQRPQPDEPVATSGNVFVGKIMKSGDKLVLASSDATYQLDDQQKALLFLRRSVKLVGTLDPSTGTIPVATIAPS
jgi:hypothetical protein